LVSVLFVSDFRTSLADADQFGKRANGTQ